MRQTMPDQPWKDKRGLSESWLAGGRSSGPFNADVNQGNGESLAKLHTVQIELNKRERFGSNLHHRDTESRREMPLSEWLLQSPSAKNGALARLLPTPACSGSGLVVAPREARFSVGLSATAPTVGSVVAKAGGRGE
jgi:hypothetical protein